MIEAFVPQANPPVPGMIPIQPSNFAPLDDINTPCGGCSNAEALVRGPRGEPAGSVLSQLDDSNRYRFDQACRVKAIKGAAQLGMRSRLSINFLPNAIYQPEFCIRTTLAAAQTHGFSIENIIFEATEGEVVSDGQRLAEILREYERMGFLTAIDDFGAGYAGLNLLADFQPDLIKIDMALIRGIDRSRPAFQAIGRPDPQSWPALKPARAG